MARQSITTRIDLHETSPLRSPHPSLATQTKLSWKLGVTVSFIALTLHVVLGLAICVGAIHLTNLVHSQGNSWFSLLAFGPTLPLLSARYLSFALDTFARLLAVTLDLLVAFVALRTATKLWSSPRGIIINDAIAFNCIQLDIASLWISVQARIHWVTKLSYIVAIACGLAVYLSSSLVFGYVSVGISKPGNRDIIMGSNQMFLGSNASGSYVPPDYSFLAPPTSGLSPYVSTTLRTLMQIDLSNSNGTIESFNLSLDTPSSLQAKNISSVLFDQTLSTRLVDCRPVSASPITLTLDAGSYVTEVGQDLASVVSAGSTNRFREQLYMSMTAIRQSKFQTYTFLLTLDSSSGQTITPEDESQVMVILGYKGQCFPEPFNTPFGPMPHVHTNETNINQAALVCRNMRTITRTTYGPDGSQLNQTLETFYAKPILSSINGVYMYLPIDIQSVHNSESLLPRYQGIGSLLNQDMVNSSRWMLPNCGWGEGSDLAGNIIPSNSSELAAISDAWGRVVSRIQHYETSLLEAFVKRDTTLVPTPVMIVTPMYRLAVIPGVLFLYGLAIILAASTLLLLLFGEGEIGKHASTASLTIWRTIDQLGVSREDEDEGGAVEWSERRLENELGAVKIKRRARRLL